MGAGVLLLLAGPSRAAGPADGTWRVLPPPERTGILSFIDPLDQRLTIVETLQPTFAMWKCPLDSDAGWSRVATPDGPVPSINRLFDFRHDPAGERLLATGFLLDYDGLGPIFGPLEVWTYPLLGDRRWAKLDIPGPLPPRRDVTAIALDSRGERLFLVGGLIYAPYREPDTLLADVWQLDLRGGLPWSQVPVAGDPLPGAASELAVYEPTERRIVLFGARDSVDNGDDALRLRAIAVDGDRRWVTLGLSTFVGYGYGRGVSYDLETNRLLYVRPVYNPDGPDSLHLFRLDLRGDGAVESSPISRGPYPDFSYDDQMCLDPAHRRIVLAGTYGVGGASGPQAPGPRADVWTLDIDGTPTWTRHFSSLSARGVYARFPMVLDLAGRRVIALSRDASRYDPSVYSYDVDQARAWEWTYCTGLGPNMRRSGTHIVFDQAGNRMFLFGGGDGGVEFGDLWELSFAFSPPRWRRIVDDRPAPRPRYGGTITYDSVRRRAILFGGYGGEALNDTWELDLRLADPVWREVPTRGVAPGARWGHAAVYDARRDAMVVFGGSTGGELNPAVLADTWLLSFIDGDAWVAAPLSGASPLPRTGHAAAYDPVGDRVIILGGRDRSGARFDHHALELGTPSHWADFLPAGPGVPAAVDLSVHYDPARDRLYALAPDTQGLVTALEWDRDTTPKPEPTAGAFRILGVGPNPTRGDVGIAFEVPRRTEVHARLYDVRGRVVRDLGTTSYGSGPHLLWWDGRGDGGDRLRDGVYFARIEVEGRAVSGKIVLMD